MQNPTPNPNSPSHPSPTTPRPQKSKRHLLPYGLHPNPHHHYHQPTPPSSNLTTPTTISPTLLAFLPPLPRAQSLLLQMASLATKLFQVSPNHSFWLSSYRGSLPIFLPSQTLISSSSSSSPSPSSTKEILSLFTSLQTQLLEAVTQLEEILDLQKDERRIASEVCSKDSTMRAFTYKLQGAKHTLDFLIDDYSDYRKVKSGSSLRLSDILSYAHRISYTTFAHQESGSALPPAPQEEQMRASQLYNVKDLQVGLSKTVEGELKEVPLQKPMEYNPLLDLPNIEDIIPPIGWKPRIPMELLSDFPLAAPPDWKPGDPVRLPPLESLLNFTNDHEEQHQQEEEKLPLAQKVLPEEQETVFVPPVQLDIIPAEDDYSSDMESSGEEDED
ncbi:mediator of RNA polymerase II transcription subunit 4-like [Macadamia integrifolia]|uniref:mediator of RNA polymerase II transcription subunit 4-like n=1 Tax=Macadamia integrifolia TaxID=60698 RepID=UPI001C4FC58C|nr:mediator of RNA polymerase II transcription subunit 4-like [Macadamia integrifolia]